MGSICHINRDPTTWTVVETRKVLKPEFGGEELLEVTYGIFDDYPDGPQDMIMFMRRSVYDKLVSKQYTVSEDSKWHRELILLDSSGRVVPATGGTIY